MELESTTSRRASVRPNKGQPPSRFGFESQSQAAGVMSTGSGSSRVSRKQARRAVLEAEMAVAQKVLELAHMEEEEVLSSGAQRREALQRLESSASSQGTPERNDQEDPEPETAERGAPVVPGPEEAAQQEPHMEEAGELPTSPPPTDQEGEPSARPVVSETARSERWEFQRKELSYQRELGAVHQKLEQQEQALACMTARVADADQQLVEAQRNLRKELQRAQSAEERMEVLGAQLRTAERELADEHSHAQGMEGLCSQLREEGKQLDALLHEAVDSAKKARQDADKWQQLYCDVAAKRQATQTDDVLSVTTTSSTTPTTALQAERSVVQPSENNSQTLAVQPTAPAVNTGGDPTLRELVGALTEALRPTDTAKPAPSELTKLTARQSTINTRLPTFGGLAEDWPSFIHLYRSTTTQCGFSNAENVQRLQQCLKGPAKDAVKLMLAVPDNVEEAIKTLERRFGRPELVIRELISKAKSLRPVKVEDAESLLVLSTAVNNIVMTMQLLKSDGHITNPALRQELIEKLPTTLRLNWGEHMRTQGLSSDSLTLDVFAKWLSARAEVATLVAPTRSATKPASTTLHAHANAGTTKHPPAAGNCPKCSGNHHLGNCARFKALATKSRWDEAYTLGVCVRCLNPGHWRSQCKGKGCSKCSGSHHSALHREHTGGSAKPQKPDGQPPRNSQPSTSTAATYTANGSNSPEVAFMTVPVQISKDGRVRQAVALIDSASSVSYIRADVAKQLGIYGATNQLSTTVVGGGTVTGQHQRVSLTLQSCDNAYEAQFQAWTQPAITAPLPTIDWQHACQQFTHLKAVPLPQMRVQHVELLIGIDHIDVHRVLEEVTGQPGEPIARRLPLGWTCFGPVTTTNGNHQECTLHVATLPQPSLEALVSQFWEDEQVGMVPESDLTVAEQHAEKLTTDSMALVNGRVTTRIPWIQDDYRPSPPSNRPMAEKRLVSLENALRKAPDSHAEYSKVIRSYVEKGYIVRRADSTAAEPNQWLLPHFPIIRREKETTKVRVVFDAAARHQGIALNDTMHAGPKLQQDLVLVLLRFCWDPGAIVGDIAEMFLQVQLEESDRPYVRFLWRESPEETPAVHEFCRLVFGLKASPYLACRALKEVVKQGSSDNNQAACKAAEESFYIDDFLNSQPTPAAAVAVRRDVQELLGTGSFHLRKWRSNSREVLESIPEADRAADAMMSIDESRDPASAMVVKTLGVVWDAATDSFTYRYNAPDAIQFTKRSVLSKMASIFDPRGHLSPFTIRARLLFQEACILSHSWDDRLPSDLEQKWQRWFAELAHLSRIKIPRCVKALDRPAESATITVHTFTDASTHATAAATYVRAAYPDGFTQVSLVFAKARAAPLKKVTIPKMELRGAVLGLRCSVVISKALSIPVREHHFWSDSINVIYWIRSAARNFKQDVAHRISEIQAATSPGQWRHVPGVLNPADYASRGMKANDLVNSDAWWRGPEFLRQAESEWPLVELSPPAQLPGELKNRPKMTFITQSTQSRLDPATYSTWTRLIRVTAWCWRFVNCLKTRTQRVTKGASPRDQPDTDGTRGGRQKPIKTGVQELTAAELKQAERYWFARTQREEYAGTLRRLLASQELPASDPLRRLNPVLDTTAHPAVMVLSGRLRYAENLPEDVRQPVILPQHHRVTVLLIQQEDEECRHGVGTQHLLSNLRQRFWIVHGAAAVKRVRANCVTCQKRTARPAEQLMGPLPDHRVCGSLKPFSRCGVDYAGPFHTKQGRGRAAHKRYLCVFTCLETRACHLEMAYSLDTPAFLMAFARFVKRRGSPTMMVSDNGTNFVAGERELREAVEALDRNAIGRYYAQEGIDWRFNPPRAPHFGGVFEIVVKAAKRALATVLSRADLTDEELATAFVEAEYLINTRPLTPVSDDINDEQPLTPQHFLVGRLDAPLAKEIVALDERQHLRRRWEVIQRLVEAVWARWRREFLPALNIRKRWQQAKKSIAEGDVVVCASPDIPRGLWPLGRVMTTFPGVDGEVRVVEVKTGGKVKKRAIHHLVPLPIG